MSAAPVTTGSTHATTATVEGVPVDLRHWVGGRRVASAAVFDDVSPIDETVIARVHAGGEAEVDAAVAAARQAYPGWAALPRTERADILRAPGRRESTRGPRIWPGSRPVTTAHCCVPTGAA